MSVGLFRTSELRWRLIPEEDRRILEQKWVYTVANYGGGSNELWREVEEFIEGEKQK